MDLDRNNAIDQAKSYLKGEGIAEVYSVEFVKETSSAFGKDFIVLAEIEDEQESECWVIGGSTPMNLYPKSKFNYPEEAYQFHFGTIAQLLQRRVEEKSDNVPDWIGYDAFICHASEDKEDFVRPLAEELANKNFYIWYDEFELTVGDSLRESIDRGLRKSAYGIVVLSKSFFSKEWTQYELNGLVNREMSGEKVILPVWYKIGREEIVEYSPPLADKVAVPADEENVAKVAQKLYEAIIENAQYKIAKERAETQSDS